jgi:flagellin-like protein
MMIMARVMARGETFYRGDNYLFFMMSRSRSGISPVVATVILVAIAIVIAIAVAFWATGLVGVFTRYEKIEITSAYAVPGGAQGAAYTITISAKNSGSSPATIDQVLINGVPVCQGQGAHLALAGNNPPNINVLQCQVNQGALALNPGDTVQIAISLNAPAGVTVEVALHSASGKLYPYSVLLP